MEQYIKLLKEIKEKGTYKPPARENMPSTLSLFGYQFRHNLSSGFPLLTTKKMWWKGVVIELLWFLRGDTNIKYLVDNDVHIWNEDAYQFYLKKCKEDKLETIMTFEYFISTIKCASDFFKSKEINGYKLPQNYIFGDCGYQYGKVWRNFKGNVCFNPSLGKFEYEKIDQIKNLIEGLIKTPESRRHIVTSIDPAHDTELALYWCHAMFQFNCRPISVEDRWAIFHNIESDWNEKIMSTQHSIEDEELSRLMDEHNIPKYYLDCQLYQRSADIFLGVPFNIASYALLIEIISKMVNMIPSEFIHTFGDVHIYENHKEQIELQLTRTTIPLPILKFEKSFEEKLYDFEGVGNEAKFSDFEKYGNLNTFINSLSFEDFVLEGYNPYDSIKGELKTGLK